MATLDELKATVLQTLENTGVLSDIRARLRATVFKVIDTHESNLKAGVGFYLQNPKIQTLKENPQFMLCAELIREFLEFYKMDYTLQVFKPECNLPNEVPQRKDIGAKFGVKNVNDTAPILMQLASFQDKSAPSPQINQMSPQANIAQDKSPSLNNSSSPNDARPSVNKDIPAPKEEVKFNQKKEEKKKEVPKEIPKPKEDSRKQPEIKKEEPKKAEPTEPKAAEPKAEVKRHEPKKEPEPKKAEAKKEPEIKDEPKKLEKAKEPKKGIEDILNRPLTKAAEPKKESSRKAEIDALRDLPPIGEKKSLKKGYAYDIIEKVELPPKRDSADQEKKHLQDVDSTVKKLEDKEKKSAIVKQPDVDEIEEKIQVDDDGSEHDDLAGSKGQRVLTESAGLGSMSLGVDPSVDSLALEGYDIVEPVEKV